jgi:hypothetical protein
MPGSGKLCAGLAGLAGAGHVVPAVSEKALRELRRRLGPAPFKALFEVVAGPLAQPGTPGVCFAGMRTVAFDGINSLKIPDTERNRCWIGRIWYRLAFAGYPTLRLMCLVETGTRGKPSKPSTPPVPTRRQLVTAILLSQPRHDWHGWELAEKLQNKQHNLLTQLAE